MVALATIAAAQPQRNFGPVRGWGDDIAWKPKPEGYFKHVATGWYFSVGLRLDGTIEVWGVNGQYNVINGRPSGSGWVKIAAGYEHAYAMGPDGAVLGWGRGDHGETTTPTTIPNCYSDIACGENFTVAVRCDGTLATWGLDYCFNPVPRMPTGGPFVKVAASGHFVAALRATGDDIPDRLVVWMPSQPPDPDWKPPSWQGLWPPEGCLPQLATLFGEIWCASPLYLCSNVRFVPAAILDTFLADFDAGHAHAMGIDLFTGSLTLWGADNFGQRSTAAIPCPAACEQLYGGCFGDQCYKAPPSQFPSSVKQARGGYFHTSMLLPDDRLRAWGNNTIGQASPPSGRYIRFSSAYYHGIALGRCYADCNGDGLLNAADITCWQNRLTLGDLGCDCDGNGVLRDCFRTAVAWT
ncbi:MAG: hypothetical protein JNM80_01690 [Phycisphaerae bacterium]|nr:hypothetical protein [Phycisphaerae bacterium]